MNDVTLLVDACVLIDYQKSDLSVLRHVSSTLGRLVVISEVLAEVEGFTDSDCQQIGIDVITIEDMDLLLRAGEPTASTASSISFEDKLCILACKKYGYVCVTNDEVLRKQCKADGVPTKRGLRLMVELVAARVISIEAAIAIALRIQESNPGYIHDKVMSKFRQDLSAVYRDLTF